MPESRETVTSRRSDSIPGPKYDTGRSHACDVSCHDECGGSYKCMDQDGWSGYICKCICHNVHQSECPMCDWKSGGYREPYEAVQAYERHQSAKHPPTMGRTQ